MVKYPKSALQEKFYRATTKPACFYEFEYGTIKKQHIQLLNKIEIVIIRWISDNTL